jgi:phage baseplate assembly protein V
MCEVHFQEGGQSAGFITGRFWNDSERPLATPSGEAWVVHKSGSVLKFHNDGSVELVTNQDLNATVGRNANVTVTGNLTANVSGAANVAVTGNITSSAATWNHTGNMNVTGTVTASTDVVGGGKSLKTHTHSGVTPGGGVSGAPV